MSDDWEMPDRCLREERLPDDGFDVGELLLRQLYKEYHGEWTRKTGVYHPSALSGCKRALYYDRTDATPIPKISSYLMLLFETGHALHDRLQATYERAARDFKKETTISIPPLGVYGHADGVFSSRDWVLEIKTIGKESFKSLVSVTNDHLIQVHTYMFALDIPRAQVLYMNRDTGDIRVFRVRFSNKVWEEEVLPTINFVEAAVEAGEAPEREESYYACRSCKFRQICQPSQG